jgi:2,3-bisphosphoglycerate-independent phosphoglycerate mutase
MSDHIDNMKYVILVGDGMGDLPLPELDNRTPLEAADIPAMDNLSRKGELFLTRTIPAGYPPGSDVANLSLLGYLPQEIYTGRAPLEAASMGITLADDEIACRCNLVTLDFQEESVIMVDYSADHISTAEAKELISSLAAELNSEKCQFHAGISYRHLLVHKGSLNDLETVPPHDHTGRDVTQFWQRYQDIPHLKELFDRACSILADHPVNRKRIAQGKKPANGIWLWGEGKAPDIPTIREQFNISGALISAVDLLKGIGVYGGLEIINVEGATGYLDTNYAGKASAALEALTRHDFVFVHIEAPDEAGHQGLLLEKIQAIEDFDSRIVAPIMEGLSTLPGAPPFRIAVAMDHFTPISTQTHASYPVPMIIYDSRQQGEGSGLDFNEKNAAATNCLVDNGRLFFEKLLQRH